MSNPKSQAWPRKPGTSVISGMDQQSLVEIYDTYCQPIYRYIYRQIGEVETSREITSEVFNKLLETVRSRLLEIKHIKAWLYRTAHNLVIDHYRRQRHRNHLALDDNLIEAPVNTFEAVEQRLSADELRKALNRLSPEQRQVIVLKYVEGMTNEETADIMGKTIGAVKSLQHRALNALHKILTSNQEILTV